MGCSVGTEIAGDMIRSIEDIVPYSITRVAIYKALIAALECDDGFDRCECIGISDAFDAALKEHDPGWFDDDGGMT